MKLVLFRKSYVKAHTRRTKDGRTVQIDAHYDKRVKKGATDVAHGHDLRHLDEGRRALFDRMHNEQHLLHHYHGHALRKRIAEHQTGVDALAIEVAEHRAAGRHVEAAHVENKRWALNAKKRAHEKELADVEHRVKAIGAMKDAMVQGSGAIEASSDDSHHRYAKVLGTRWVKDARVEKPDAPVAAPDDGAKEGERGLQSKKAPRSDPYEHLDIRPDTTEEQKQLGRDAILDLWNRVSADPRGAMAEGRPKPRVLANVLYSEFAETGHARLIGQTAETPDDFAAIAQVYRDPRFETLRAVFVDADGKVVGETGYTSRMPGFVTFSKDIDPSSDMAADQKAFGAAGFYLLHNHPSGRASPSNADILFTRHVAANCPGLLGHVIVDHNEYTVIDRDGSDEQYLIGNVDMRASPAVQHDVLGVKVSGPGDLVEVRKRLIDDKVTDAVVVLTDLAGRVAFMATLPKSMYAETKTRKARLQAWVRGIGRKTGAGGRAFLIFPDGELAQTPNSDWLMATGTFTDVIGADGSARQAFTMAGTDELFRARRGGRKTASHGAPQDGDTKTENGITYVLRGGRWHRETLEAHDNQGRDLEAVKRHQAGERRRYEEGSKRAQAAFEGLVARVPLPDWTTHEGVEVLRSGGSRYVAVPRTGKRSAATFDVLDLTRGELVTQLKADEVRGWLHRSAQAEQDEAHADAGDLDPNSPNYRYRDTGIVPGARKMDVTDAFRAAVKKGQLVRHNAIDWEGVEANPRQAKELITKSNLFGAVDWEALKAGGMDPGAGFLLDRIYASIGAAPGEDSPEARRDYARGIESVRDRLETCKTPNELFAAIKEMREELQGTMLDARNSELYQAVMAEYQALAASHQPLRNEEQRHKKLAGQANARVNQLEYEQYKWGARRRGKRNLEIDAKIAEAKIEQDSALGALKAFQADHPELETKKRDWGNGRFSYENDLDYAEHLVLKRASAIKDTAMAMNLEANPATRAWIALGPKFGRILQNKSESFAGHRANVRMGKVADWSWAEKGAGESGGKVTKRAAQFQLQVADHITRKGGPTVKVDSTEALKRQFNLREVQSGNWVLKDAGSAQWHVQAAAEALTDLADVLGVDPKHVAMNGRVAIAFGARGTGNAGFGGAARAHYETVHRVVNITKMKGGGSLAHELFHALDNLITEAYGGKAGAEVFATEGATDGLPSDVKGAFLNLHQAMHEGTLRKRKTIEITPEIRRLAEYNLITRGSARGIGAEILAAGSLDEAIDAVDRHERDAGMRYAKRGEPLPRKDVKNYARWREIAAAHHSEASATTASIPVGAPTSLFAVGAAQLETNPDRPYWSQPKEMAARAFQAYVEDKLREMGRHNDYLSAKADNTFYLDPLFGQRRPFPEGEERTRINAAFDHLFEMLRKDNALAKAFGRLRRPLILFRRAA